MAKFKQPDGLAPGIYFNLSNERYHQDKALSHSGITNILESDRDYYESSPLNPNREFKQTDAMKFGERCHLMLLEEKKFFQTYNVAGGGWSKDKITISSTDFKLIKESSQILRGDPETNEYFKHGYPEVSLFWIDPATGIRLRARVDYLRTFGCIDLKRLRSIRKSRLKYDIKEYGYDLQEHVYRDGVRQVKQLLRAGKIKAWDAADPAKMVEWQENPAWLKGFMDDQDSMFIFLAQRSVRPFIYRVWYFDEHIRENAKMFCEQGIRKYKYAIEKYGEKDWPYGSAKAEKFSIDDVAYRNLDD